MENTAFEKELLDLISQFQTRSPRTTSVPILSSDEHSGPTFKRKRRG